MGDPIIREMCKTSLRIKKELDRAEIQLREANLDLSYVHAEARFASDIEEARRWAEECYHKTKDLERACLEVNKRIRQARGEQ